MRRFVAARLAQSAVVLAIVATVAFALIRVAPGDPFAYDLAGVTPEVRATWRARFGHDRPLAEQYARYVANVARGDLGYSTSHRRPVREVIAIHLPRTLLLTSVALGAALLLGVTLGAWQAVKAGSAFDRITSGALLVVYSIPEFCLAILLVTVLAQWAGAFPAGGIRDLALHEYMSPARRVADVAWHLVLPAGTLALIALTVVSRHQRAALLDVLPLDYVRTARAKGLDERRVVMRHALRTAMAPTIALVGLLIPSLVAGAFFVEVVFAWPGLATVLVGAVQSRDYDLVTAGVIVVGAGVAVGSLVADLLHAAADPRARAVE